MLIEQQVQKGISGRRDYQPVGCQDTNEDDLYKRSRHQSPQQAANEMRRTTESDRLNATLNMEPNKSRYSCRKWPPYVQHDRVASRAVSQSIGGDYTHHHESGAGNYLEGIPPQSGQVTHHNPPDSMSNPFGTSDRSDPKSTSDRGEQGFPSQVAYQSHNAPFFERPSVYQDTNDPNTHNELPPAKRVKYNSEPFSHKNVTYRHFQSTYLPPNETAQGYRSAPSLPPLGGGGNLTLNFSTGTRNETDISGEGSIFGPRRAGRRRTEQRMKGKSAFDTRGSGYEGGSEDGGDGDFDSDGDSGMNA